MLLMIDNYDSFTYNIVQYFGELGEEVRTVRNDEVTIADIAAMRPDRICISPGPKAPVDAGVSREPSSSMMCRAALSSALYSARVAALEKSVA